MHGLIFRFLYGCFKGGGGVSVWVYSWVYRWGKNKSIARCMGGFREGWTDGWINERHAHTASQVDDGAHLQVLSHPASALPPANSGLLDQKVANNPIAFLMQSSNNHPL